MHWRHKLALFAIALLLSIALYSFAECTADASEPTTANDIQILQPRVSDRDAEHLGRIIDELGEEYGIDPRLIVAIVMRESSFAPEVIQGDRRGELGEVGLMQIHPRNHIANAMRPDGCDLQLTSAYCQLVTGVRYLTYVRDRCQGSTWRWIAAYGWSRCPSEEEAREDIATRRAHGFYHRIGGENWN
jgi:soluble lytic murein transglycosylase-like protein